MIGGILEGGGGRCGIESSEEAPSAAYAEIANRPDIVATEWSHQEHLRGPPTDTSDSRQLGDHLGIVKAPERVEIESPILYSIRQVHQGRLLRPRDTAASQDPIVELKQTSRGDRTPHGISDTASDRGGCLRGELLVEDGSSQRSEAVGDTLRSTGRGRADDVDQAGQCWIGGGNLCGKQRTRWGTHGGRLRRRRQKGDPLRKSILGAYRLDE